MRKFQHIPRSEKWVIFFWILLMRTKWDGTLPLCIEHAYNWYLPKAYDLESMLDTFIGVWKCVEKILEPFEWKKSIFFVKIWDNSNKSSEWLRSKKWVIFWMKKWNFFIQMALKFFLRNFRHQWRYLTCSLDPKLQADTNYIRVGWIGVTYRPTSPASAESKKSLIFRICGFVGIFSCLCQKNWIFAFKWL